MKENEKIHLSELESLDATADSVGLNEVEVCIKSAIKAEILSIYQFEERNLIQKSKLNWLSVWRWEHWVLPPISECKEKKKSYLRNKKWSRGGY